MRRDARSVRRRERTRRDAPVASAASVALPALVVTTALGARARPEPVRRRASTPRRSGRRPGSGCSSSLTAALIAGPIRLPRRAIARARRDRRARAAGARLRAVDGLDRAGGRRGQPAAASTPPASRCSSCCCAATAPRSSRSGRSPLGALVVAGWVLAGMLRGDETLFFAGRLHEPLGYINGQANFFVLAFWPCVALAERRTRRGARAPRSPGSGWPARRSSAASPCSASRAARSSRRRCR